MFKESVEVARPDVCSQANMIKSLRDMNSTSTCCGRFVGWLMMYIGIVLTFTPVIALLKWIPLVGWLFAKVLSFVVYIFAFVVSVAGTLLTISIAWIWYRPLYGLCLLLAVGALIFVTFHKF